MKTAAYRPRRFSVVPHCEYLEDRTVLSQQSLIDYSAVLANPAAYDPSRILVRFRPELSATDIAQQILPGSQLGEPIALVPGARSVRLPAGVSVSRALALFQASPFVRYAEPNGYWRVAETIPNDEHFGRLYGMRNTGQGGGTPGADIKASFAWDISTGGTGIVIANIDTGIDYDHPDIYKNIWINQGEIPASRLGNLTDTDGDGKITFWDLNDPVNQGPGKITDLNGDGRISGSDLLRPIAGDLGGWVDSTDGDSNGRVDDLVGWNFAATSTNNPRDDFGHGTHTAGTHSGLGNNGIGVAGVTWKAQIAVVKFLGAGGGGSWEDSALAVSYAVTIGAQLSTNSWGGGSDAQVLRDAIAAAREAGHLFVAAAGNNGSNIDNGGFFPAGYSADFDNVLTVAATDNRDARASFSNFGRNRVHLGAPGVDVYSSVPTSACSLCHPSGYSNLSGTSMATPHVAGAALLVWNMHPKWTYAQVKEQLLTTVDPIPSMNGITVTGGRLNVDAALGLIAAGPRIGLSSPNQNILGPVSSLRVVFDRAVDVSTFTLDDIRSFSGPGGAIKVTDVQVIPGTGDTQFSISFTAQGQTGAYRMEIGPEIYDLKGNPMDQNRNGTTGEDPDDIFAARFGLQGPRVTAQTPSGGFFEPASSMRVTFNVPMNPDTFTVKDIVSLTGPGGAIAVKSVAVVPDTQDRTYELTFAEQADYGNYTLVIGPDIRDRFDNLMDQNNNLIPGEKIADRFSGSFTILNPCQGPDGAGYTGCTAQFEDASILGQPGTVVLMTGVDDDVRPLSLGTNQFRFYNVTYTGANQMFVNSNGLITFGTGTSAYSNGDLRNDPVMASIAVLWDDWIKAGGQPMVLYRFEDLDGDGTDDRLVIEWNNVLHYPSSPRPVTFQAHLYLNTGTESYLTFNYFDLDTGDDNRIGASATIGIKAAGSQGNNRLVIAANQVSPYLRSNHALFFASPGASPGGSPSGGGGLDGLALAALGSDPIRVKQEGEAAVQPALTALPAATPVEQLFTAELRPADGIRVASLSTSTEVRDGLFASESWLIS